jgi:hypothetical protein
MNDEMDLSNAELFLDSNRGIYIPRDFAEQVRHELVENVTAEDWDILQAGPDHELYWDVWNDVEQKAVIDDGNRKFTLYQDGDLWLVPLDD